MKLKKKCADMGARIFFVFIRRKPKIKPIKNGITICNGLLYAKCAKPNKNEVITMPIMGVVRPINFGWINPLKNISSLMDESRGITITRGSVSASAIFSLRGLSGGVYPICMNI